MSTTPTAPDDALALLEPLDEQLGASVENNDHCVTEWPFTVYIPW